MQNTSFFGKNPYLDQQATSLRNLSNQNLSQNVMPGIRSGATAAGQYGGSRQGIAEGVAAGNAQTGLDAATASLYNRGYEADQNFYSAQRGQDLQQYGLGANIFNSGTQGAYGVGQGQYNLGLTNMNAPMSALQNYSNTISPYSGLGSSQTTSANQGGGALGVMGGALAGAQIGSNLGFGGGGSSGNFVSSPGMTWANQQPWM